MKSWKIQFTRSAQKELEMLPKVVLDRMRNAIGNLEDDPYPPGNKKLKGEENTFQIRVGDYRVIDELHDVEIVILIIRIRHRQDAYQ